MGRYAQLPEHLRELLRQIEPSRDQFLPGRYIEYYPCIVTLRSGTVVDCVYVQDEAPYRDSWGVYPGEDSKRSSIAIAEVVSLAESPSRLPARFANELYKAGETAMGGHAFTVQFADGTAEFYMGGNAVDFIDYPPEKSQKDVVAVRNGGRGAACSRPRHLWCLYS
jgi:hypothetical protein